MNKTILLGGIILLAIVGFVGWQTLGQKSSVDTQNTSATSDNNQTSNGGNQFQNPKKAAHYESNTPEHGAVLAGVPVNVVIDFNFDLASGSTIEITNNGTDYGEGQTTIDNNKLVLRRGIQQAAPDGIYTVAYKACWADGSCHDGEFQFKIDKSQASTFTDMRNKNEVTVELKNIAFNPQRILVSKGTKVTWHNSDSVEHTVNTDSHPAHTYYLGQNSRTLTSGDTYSVTFDKAGIYPYHCTPHAGTMTGMVLVE